MAQLTLEHPFEETFEPAPAAGRKKPLLDRLGAYFRAYLGRPRGRDARIGRFIQAHGGTLTDELEREISRRFGHSL